MIKVRARYQYEVGSDDMVLLAFVKNHLDGKDYQIHINLKERTPGFLVTEPTVQSDLVTSSDLLQTIFNALWDGGMRPSEFKDIENETKALKIHLNDMRRLVFSHINPYNINELK